MPIFQTHSHFIIGSNSFLMDTFFDERTEILPNSISFNDELVSVFLQLLQCAIEIAKQSKSKEMEFIKSKNNERSRIPAAVRQKGWIVWCLSLLPVAVAGCQFNENGIPINKIQHKSTLDVSCLKAKKSHIISAFQWLHTHTFVSIFDCQARKREKNHFSFDEKPFRFN